MPHRCTHTCMTLKRPQIPESGSLMRFRPKSNGAPSALRKGRVGQSQLDWQRTNAHNPHLAAANYSHCRTLHRRSSADQQKSASGSTWMHCTVKPNLSALVQGECATRRGRSPCLLTTGFDGEEADNSTTDQVFHCPREIVARAVQRSRERTASSPETCILHEPRPTVSM